MTKRSYLFILAAALALSGCMMSLPESKDKKISKDELTFPPPPDEPRFYYERSIFSSADVKPDTVTDKLRRALTGELPCAGHSAAIHVIARERARQAAVGIRLARHHLP